MDMDGDGYSVEDGDCDDNDGWSNPAQAEMCDNVDNDCDGEVDEGCAESVAALPKGGTCGCNSTGSPAPWILLLAAAALFRRRDQLESAARQSS